MNQDPQPQYQAPPTEPTPPNAASFGQGQAPQSALPPMPQAQGMPQAQVTSPQGPTPSHQNNPKKVILIVIAAMVSLLVLAGVGLVILSMLGGVSKADYQQADGHASAAQSKLTTLTIDVNDLAYVYGPTETQVDNKVDTAKKSIAAYKQAVAALADDKAVTKGEQAKLYKAYKDKSDRYVTLIENYVDASAVVSAPLSACEQKMSSSASAPEKLTTNLNECITTLSAIKDVKDSDVKAQLDTMIAYLVELKGYAEQYINTPASSFTQRYDIQDKMFDLDDTYENKLKDHTSNIEKKFKDTNPTDQLRALADSLLNASLDA